MFSQLNYPRISRRPERSPCASWASNPGLRGKGPAGYRLPTEARIACGGSLTFPTCVDPTGLEPVRASLQTRCTATRALGPRCVGTESNRHSDSRVGYGHLGSPMPSRRRKTGCLSVRWRARTRSSSVDDEVVKVHYRLVGIAQSNRGGSTRIRTSGCGFGDHRVAPTPCSRCFFGLKYKRAASFRKRLLERSQTCSGLVMSSRMLPP